MQNNTKNIFSIVLEIMKLEASYEESQEEHNHLLCLLNKFGKDNKNKISIAKYQCDTFKKQIDELIKQISEMHLSTVEQIYYDLYKENSELLKKSWKCETEIEYISSSLIFDCICDDEIDSKLAKQRDELKEQKRIATEKMKDIELKMSVIYSQ
ncbi:MAG: hypothetical protein PHD15_05890 [Clostridia bacterium]|nr:hypothetical protein [Clostridia bacterium]MDD4387263.1 hypothetical protein [Clostridia bacterium]